MQYEAMTLNSALDSLRGPRVVSLDHAEGYYYAKHGDYQTWVRVASVNTIGNVRLSNTGWEWAFGLLTEMQKAHPHILPDFQCPICKAGIEPHNLTPEGVIIAYACWRNVDEPSPTPTTGPVVKAENQ